MTLPTIARATAFALVAYLPSAHAGFFGTFTPVSEPSALSLLALGGGVAAVALYLKRARRDRKRDPRNDPEA